jgi:hypothetical protein
MKTVIALRVLEFHFNYDNFQILIICYIIFKFLKLFLIGIYFMLMFASFNIFYYQMSISGTDSFYVLLNYVILSQYLLVIIIIMYLILYPF